MPQTDPYGGMRRWGEVGRGGGGVKRGRGRSRAVATLCPQARPPIRQPVERDRYTERERDESISQMTSRDFPWRTKMRKEQEKKRAGAGGGGGGRAEVGSWPAGALPACRAEAGRATRSPQGAAARRCTELQVTEVRGPSSDCSRSAHDARQSSPVTTSGRRPFGGLGPRPRSLPDPPHYHLTSRPHPPASFDQ
jgi:hypothetical protein